MNEKRGHWYLLTGLVLGVALGLLVAWIVAPVQYVETSPATLRSDFKDEYRYMIAASYAVTGNLGRARARIGLVEDKDPIQALRDQSQRMLANNTAPEVVHTLADLSQALQNNGTVPAESASPQPSFAPQDGQPDTGNALSPTPHLTIPLITDTPVSTTSDPTQQIAAPENTTSPQTTLASIAPHPAFTPTFTPGPPFQLVNQSPVCDPAQPGLLQVSLEDSEGKPAAGIELVVTWLGGEEHFFTGLKPELGNGYADFVMSTNTEYVLSLSNGNTRVTGLVITDCNANDGSSYPGGIRLEFKQP